MTREELQQLKDQSEVMIYRYQQRINKEDTKELNILLTAEKAYLDNLNWQIAREDKKNDPAKE